MSQIEVPIRIATWSGPRNISTAMMRAWDNRRDTFVIDEPFYAYYLKATRKQHPGADEVIATGETDWRKVVAQLTGPIPNGKRIFFQKQMTHHLLPDIDRLGYELFSYSRPTRSHCLVPQKARGPSAGRSRLCATGRDFRFRPRSHECDSANPRCKRCAGKSKTNVAATLQGGRCRLYRVDAFVAARLPRDRWYLGKALVWRSGKIDIVSAVSSQR